MKKNARAVIFLMLFGLTIWLPKEVFARATVSLHPYLGMSGTTTIYMLIAWAESEADDETSEMVMRASSSSDSDTDDEQDGDAVDRGLFTGEIGMDLDINFGVPGIRIGGMAGYYKYNAFKIPDTAYTMLMAGIEPYLFFGSEDDGMYISGGYGLFKGSMWNQDPEFGLDSDRNHEGYAIWGGVGFCFGGFDIDMRVRYHHFNKISTYQNDTPVDSDEYLELEHDTVFVLRFVVPLNIVP